MAKKGIGASKLVFSSVNLVGLKERQEVTSNISNISSGVIGKLAGAAGNNFGEG